MKTFILFIVIIGIISIPIILTFLILGFVFQKMRFSIKYALISLLLAFVCIITGSFSYNMLEPSTTTNTTTANRNEYQSFENNISDSNPPKMENDSENQLLSSTKEIDNSENALMQLFPSSNYKYKNAKIISAYNEGYYFIQYDYMGSAWNESDLVKLCISDYIAYCKEAYKLDFVNCIRFSVFVPVNDSNGNQSIDHVLTMQINRNTFNALDWANYENQAIYDIIVNNSENFYLAPVIEKYIEKEKITFTSYSDMFS